MGYRKVYKNRDIRFRCANYDFKSGHCKAECMIYDSYENVEENGQKRVVSIPAWPVGCSGDPNCKNFKETTTTLNLTDMSERLLTPKEAGEIIDRLIGEWEESGKPFWMLKDAIRRVKKQVVIDEEESD